MQKAGSTHVNWYKEGSDNAQLENSYPIFFWSFTLLFQCQG